MGNIGKRERYYLILLAIVVVVFLIYFLGIRNLGYRYQDLTAQRDQLQGQIDYYESLKTQNAETQTQINQLKNDISETEATFLPYLNSEVIENYVLKTFEEAGCPYLVSVSATDLVPSQPTMPSGTAATDALRSKRITVQYATTDGFNIGEYNRNVSVVSGGVVDEEALDALLEDMYWHGADSRKGYDEFVNGLRTFENVAPDCIKINSVSVSQEAGYLILNAEIDFYSVTFNNRVSTPDTSAPYLTWNGDENINTDGGFIGYPFIVENPASDWFNMIMSDSDALAGERPFATYYSAALFKDYVTASGLASVLETGEPTQIPVEDEAVED